MLASHFSFFRRGLSQSPRFSAPYSHSGLSTLCLFEYWHSYARNSSCFITVLCTKLIYLFISIAPAADAKPVSETDQTAFIEEVESDEDTVVDKED